MISSKIEKALNQQVLLEAESSQIYLAMASWAEVEGLNGIAEFLFTHSDEERMHMLKLLKFINERGGHGIIPTLKAPPLKYKGIKELFQEVLDHEIHVSNEINKLVDRGNTVLVIEHNMDVIKVADHIIDIGPEGGDGGGRLLFEGLPEDLVKVKESFTGKFLQAELK